MLTGTIKPPRAPSQTRSVSTNVSHDRRRAAGTPRQAITRNSITRPRGGDEVGVSINDAPALTKPTFGLYPAPAPTMIILRRHDDDGRMADVEGYFARSNLTHAAVCATSAPELPSSWRSASAASIAISGKRAVISHQERALNPMMRFRRALR